MLTKVNRDSDFFRWFVRNWLEDHDAENAYRIFGSKGINTTQLLRSFHKDLRFEQCLKENFNECVAEKLRIGLEKDANQHNNVRFGE